MSRLPVIAAVPNYNMAEGLQRLLPQIIDQDYDHIYVLDDASTDNSREVVRSFGSKVTFIAGTINLCSGGNRNRILKVLPAPAIIHFLDADTELISRNTPKIIATVMDDDRIGLGGGLVMKPDGRQEMWNFGPRLSLYSSVSAYVYYRIHTRLSEVKRKRYLRLWGSLFSDWPNIDQPPVRSYSYWVHEANMFIRSEVFAKVGGFDEHVRSHDIQDLAIRIQRAGYQTVFEPQISIVQHTNLQVRSGNRQKARRQAAWYIIRKNGILSFILPGGHFKPRYNK